MNLLLFTLCIAVFSTADPVSVHDSLERLQQEMEQLKRDNEVMKKHYDEKIANLEQQPKWERNLSPESGNIFLKFFQSIYPYRISKQINCES